MTDPKTLQDIVEKAAAYANHHFRDDVTVAPDVVTRSLSDHEGDPYRVARVRPKFIAATSYALGYRDAVDAAIAKFAEQTNIGIVKKPPPPPPPPAAPIPSAEEIGSWLATGQALADCNPMYSDEVVRKGYEYVSEQLRARFGGMEALQANAIPSDEEIAKFVRCNLYGSQEDHASILMITNLLGNSSTYLLNTVRDESGSDAEACAIKLAITHFASRQPSTKKAVAPNEVSTEISDELAQAAADYTNRFFQGGDLTTSDVHAAMAIVVRTKEEFAMAGFVDGARWRQAVRTREIFADGTRPEKPAATFPDGSPLLRTLLPNPIVFRDPSELAYWDAMTIKLAGKGDTTSQSVASAADEMVEERRARTPLTRQVRDELCEPTFGDGPGYKAYLHRGKVCVQLNSQTREFDVLNDERFFGQDANAIAAMIRSLLH